eukprot:s1274_g15.t1
MPPLDFYAAWKEADGTNADHGDSLLPFYEAWAVADGSQVNLPPNEGDGTTETPEQPQENVQEKKRKKKKLPQPLGKKTVELTVNQQVQKESSETEKSEADEEEKKALKYYKYQEAWKRVKEEDTEDENPAEDQDDIFEWITEETATSSGATSSCKPAALEAQTSKAGLSDAELQAAVAKKIEILSQSLRDDIAKIASPEVKAVPPWAGKLPPMPPPTTQVKTCPTPPVPGSAKPAEPALPPRPLLKVPGSARPAEPLLPPRPIAASATSGTPMSGHVQASPPGPQMWPPKAAPLQPPPALPNDRVRGHADKRSDGKYYATCSFISEMLGGKRSFERLVRNQHRSRAGKHVQAAKAAKAAMGAAMDAAWNYDWQQWW